jgi:hypothetical protein
LRLPEEHGAWGILLVPFLTSAVVAGRWNWELLLSAVCMLSLFLLRGSLESRAFRGQCQAVRERIGLSVPPWGVLFLVTVAMAGGFLLLVYRRLELLGLGLLAAALYLLQRQLVRAHRREGPDKRSLAAELVGVAVLTLTAPLAWIAARGSLFSAEQGKSALDAAGLEVWLLNLLFFLGSILYVKYRIRAVAAHRSYASFSERVAFVWPVVVYQAILLVFLIGWLVLGLAASSAQGRNLRPVALFLAFLPGFLRANGLLFQLGQCFPITRLGWSEILHSALFGGLLVIGFRFAG